MEKENKVPLALEILKEAMDSDPGYKQAWVANIAMAFQDTHAEHWRNKGVWEISNNAAERFLASLFSNVGKP